MCKNTPAKVWEDDFKNTDTMFLAEQSRYKCLRTFKNEGFVPLIVTDNAFGAMNEEREVFFVYRGRGRIWEIFLTNILSNDEKNMSYKKPIVDEYIDNISVATAFSIQWLKTGDVDKFNALLMSYTVVNLKGKWIKKHM